MGINREAGPLRLSARLLLVARSLGLKFLFSFLNLLAKLFEAIVAELARFLENFLLLFVSVVFSLTRPTLDSATSIPSIRSSPWILGAPHSGFSRLMRRINVKAQGRFWDGHRHCPNDQCQWARKPR
jgi:hypothetical protein